MTENGSIISVFFELHGCSPALPVIACFMIARSQLALWESQNDEEFSEAAVGHIVGTRVWCTHPELSSWLSPTDCVTSGKRGSRNSSCDVCSPLMQALKAVRLWWQPVEADAHILHQSPRNPPCFQCHLSDFSCPGCWAGPFSPQSFASSSHEGVHPKPSCGSFAGTQCVRQLGARLALGGIWANSPLQGALKEAHGESYLRSRLTSDQRSIFSCPAAALRTVYAVRRSASQKLGWKGALSVSCPKDHS